MTAIRQASIDELRLFIPLTKLDVERRLVIGTAAAEERDKAGEIMDYESAKPMFQAWSMDCMKRSGGRSKGNLRAMHNPRLAAGKIDDITFDDANKQVNVIAKVVDDNEWQKCLEGVYTGFSVGGGYKAKWTDQRGNVYTPRPAEMSLVDNPCISSSTFAELVKADGSIGQLELRGRIHSFSDLWQARPKSFGQMWRERPKSFAELWSK